MVVRLGEQAGDGVQGEPCPLLLLNAGFCHVEREVGARRV